MDPFCGSGVVPLEAVLAGRSAWANDLNPYAYVITKGKLGAPENEDLVARKTETLLSEIKREAADTDFCEIPGWVREFFHPDTLREVLTAFRILLKKEEYLLTSCLLGILHHQRPGFLSYPASHLVPYLRKRKFPPEMYPEMYEYRDLRSRLVAKVKRAYRRPNFPAHWTKRKYRVWQTNAMSLPLEDNCVDAIITSPPYFGALDYARDNRMRLWFLGCENWKDLDDSLTARKRDYIPQISNCLKEMYRVLKLQKYCILVLGDVEKNGKTQRTAEILADLAVEVTKHGFVIETIYDDRIPDNRRSRRETKMTKYERILVMRKTKKN